MNFNIFRKNDKDTAAPSHVIQLQQGVSEAVMRQVQTIYGLNPQVYLSLWISGVQYALALDNDDYRRQLRLALDNNGYGNVSVERFYQHRPAMSQQSLCLVPDQVWLTLTSTPCNPHYYILAEQAPLYSDHLLL